MTRRLILTAVAALLLLAAAVAFLGSRQPKPLIGPDGREPGAWRF